ncbi:2',3'-cyclic-nucleotide 3'-phosphodiesterase-like [Argiope bruennichi]|uniref:2',3'-cyclic-nucleotide 3'-phosphodiesterase-like n=1 Tax=Argiope bruennichi TaxID=94029 RepID=UPI0024945B70|nr:2',3'-cyclic-nucleotide 3'-phosphodiesterase-like [Argiope bruennichi]XP_055951952.1 2',3'-cyclic-nucleotide 3'-phosphodiesterase-like [Argiope bruennichi]
MDNPSSFAEKYVPGSDADSSDIFKFPYTIDRETIDFLREHGRIMFIIRGPPGTGKDSLSSMLADCYKNASVFSADSYFNDTFAKSKRDSSSLKKSHEFCQKKVHNACIKGIHPIIVKNTHIKKFEVQKYVDFAAEYNYTIIMAITTHKMKVTPEILAKSNTKGLSVSYFQKRLKQWEDFIPVNTGWFLNIHDSSFLLKQVQIYLNSLLRDGKFCRVFDIFDEGQFRGYFKPRKLLYCIAACGKNNTPDEIRPYYQSDSVKQHYGECFPIVIQGYIVTLSYVAALIYLNKTMRNLVFMKHNDFVSTEDDEVDMLTSALASVQISNDNFKKHCSTTKFEYSAKSTFHQKEDEIREDIDINNCSYLILAQHNKDEAKPPRELINLFSELLSNEADGDGIIELNKMRLMEGRFRYCRLPDNAWLIRPSTDLYFKAVFTGLYV